MENEEVVVSGLSRSPDNDCREVPPGDDQWSWKSVTLVLGLVAMSILSDWLLIKLGVTPKTAILLGLAQIVVILGCVKSGDFRDRMADAALAFLKPRGGAK